MISQVLEDISLFIALGGPVVALLVAVSVVAAALIGLKFFEFWREQVGKHVRLLQALSLWRSGNRSDARRLAEASRSAVGACMALAMRLKFDGKAAKAEIEEEIGRLALARLHRLQKGFRSLDAIAQIAPLLGLFGTVLGMIEAFQNLQSAGSSVDPSILAGGIWVALLTTAVGLAVAMPVSLALTWLETRLENERVAIETMAGAILGDQETLVPQPSGISVLAAGELSHAT